MNETKRRSPPNRTNAITFTTLQTRICDLGTVPFGWTLSLLRCSPERFVSCTMFNHLRTAESSNVLCAVYFLVSYLSSKAYGYGTDIRGTVMNGSHFAVLCYLLFLDVLDIWREVGKQAFRMWSRDSGAHRLFFPYGFLK
ncbi:hypothetical protein MPH_09538 [Macrophomina phaseolina MS6]|uniref:Uncharacterized protein n=1 Tax=Macrophomina phaseolina (strain MS6) TaxID=1126212 RepID=K2RK84_MACPH|nr:hypothetical protein MPH_09538 [Macrophomina phaseolina MS6]